MPRLSSLTLSELLDAFASTAPAPGGGSAAALAGSTGVALLIMVARLSAARDTTTGSRALAEAADRLQPIRDELTALIDRDADAYTALISARRRPPDAVASGSRGTIASALRAAIDTPLATMRACQEALDEARTIAAHGLPAALPDVGVAIELLRAAARGAAMNVDANLTSPLDPGDAERASRQCQQLRARGETSAEQALALIAEACSRRRPSAPRS
jgi:glutamate formiminotransferase/formiminotetrahydrofolate cyclodeaminase